MLFNLFTKASSAPAEVPALAVADCEMVEEEEKAATAPEAESEEPEPAEEEGSVEELAWLKKQGFAEGDLRSEITIDEIAKSPMMLACEKGELKVCKFLYKHGAAEDVTKENGEF